MSFADLRVSRKIAIAVAVPVLIFISVGMTSWYATRVISQEADANALAYSRLHLLDLTFTGLVEEQRLGPMWPRRTPHSWRGPGVSRRLRQVICQP